MSVGSAPSARFALAVLLAINLMNFYDRQVLAALGEPVRKEFELGDKALGSLSTAFTLLYAAMGIPLGRLADRVSRVRLLAAGVFVWSLFTAASGLVRSYAQLFALRLGVGVGEAVCAPAATSLIADLFPAQRRGRALSVFMLGLPAGIALSYLISGRVAAEYEWRSAFLVAAVPGLICFVAALFLREPVRGSLEGPAAAGGRRPGSPYLHLLSIPTLRWLIVSGALHNFNLYALGTFLAPYLMRFYGQNIREANDLAMVIYGLSGLPGLFLSGFVADAARRRRADGRLLFGAAACLLAAPLALLALRLGRGELIGFAALLASSSALMYAYYSAVYPTIPEVVEPSLRGTAMAVYFCVMYFLGGSLGPLVVGGLSDHFSVRAAAAAGVTAFTQEALEPYRAEGLRAAMVLIPSLQVALAAVLWAASRTLGKKT